ncbi:uncharacterized protein A1O9_00144, partial [Exophiala aquamarina CBS 119918]
MSPTVLDSFRGDLLSTLPFTRSANAFNSIDEYIQIHRGEDLVLKIAPDVAHPVISVVFPSAVQDPCVFHCFLAAAQSLYEFRRSPWPPERSSVMSHLQGKAFSALQQRLSAPSAHLDDGVLYSIIHLMIAAGGQYDSAAVKSHLIGIRQIIVLRGGLGNTPAHQTIRGILTVIEYFNALDQYLDGSPDDLEAIPSSQLDYARHPFSPRLCKLIATLPDGFAEVALSGRISVQCIQLLSSVASWQSLINESPTTSSGSSDQTRDRLCRLFCDPRECARNAVLILLYMKRSGKPLGLEYIICIGLAICVRHLSQENRTSLFDNKLLDSMMKNIKAIKSPQPSDSEAILWLSLIVNWRTQSIHPVKKADDVLDLVITKFPGLQTWKKVSTVCQKFWWFDCLKDDLEKCWRKSFER